MKDELQTGGFPKRTRPFPYLVLVLSILFTVWVTYYLVSVNRTKNMARFNNRVLETEATIRDALNTHIALLRSATAFFAASEKVSQDEFRIYFARLRTSEFYPGLLGFGFAKRVRLEERATVEQQMRLQNLTNFTIWPAGERDEYFPIVYIEPMNWRNERAVGYDMFSDPVRQAAMARATRDGFAMSGIVTLVQETDVDQQPGFLLYVAVYSGHFFPQTEAERLQRLQGFVYSPFRAGDLFSAIFRGQRKLLTSLEVYEGGQITETNMLYRSQNFSTSANPRFTITNNLSIAGHNWTLVHHTTPEFEQTLDRVNALWVFVTGFSFSWILFGVTFSMARSRQRAEESEWRLMQKSEKLRASEELHRTISETAADAIITIDASSKIITVNRAAERIFGHAPEVLVGQSLTMLMPERMASKHLAGLSRYLATGQRGISWGGVELPGLHKDGHEIPLEISFSEMHKPGKRIFVGIIRDITERKKTEEEINTLNRDLENRVRNRTAELLDANNQMESFVYSIAHDLRAPLRSMRGFAQALQEDYAANLDAQAKDYSARIVASAKFMDDLINDLLAFSTITRAELTLSPVSLNQILLEVREQLAEEIREKKAVIEIPDDLPEVIAHETTLRQIATNLISNALKFVPPTVAPRVRVRAEDAGNYWRIWIEDNGIGIPPEYHHRIFGIFERLHGGDYSGTGIGLAIVRKGIERMNGRVGVKSEPRKGSRFWFELPKAR